MRKLTEAQQRQMDILDYHMGKTGRDVFTRDTERVKSAWDYIPRTDDNRTTSQKMQDVFDWYED